MALLPGLGNSRSFFKGDGSNVPLYGDLWWQWLLVTLMAIGYLEAASVFYIAGCWGPMLMNTVESSAVEAMVSPQLLDAAGVEVLGGKGCQDPL